MAKKEAKKTDKKEIKATETSMQKVENFLTDNKKCVIAVLCVVIAALVAFVTTVIVTSSLKEKNLGKIEAIEYRFLDNADTISANDAEARMAQAAEELKPFINKSGVVGARADLLNAEILIMKNDFAGAISMYEMAAKKVKGTYLYSIAKFNEGYAREQANDAAGALKCYEECAADAECVNKPRVLFNVGRLKEALNDMNGAKDAYTQILGLEDNESDWIKVARTRLLELQLEGKVE
ncbi:MAG: hypothetical protein MJ169_06740 [Treponema sp.]|nr:hypothetical protein [Treponema sp.]